MQFQQLRDPRPFVLIVEHGRCAHPGLRVARFGLYPYSEPNEGLESSGQLEIPIHQLMKDGYALALLDVRRGTIGIVPELADQPPVLMTFGRYGNIWLLDIPWYDEAVMKLNVRVRFAAIVALMQR